MADADTPPAGWDGGEAHAHDAVSGVQGAPAEGTTSALEANPRPKGTRLPRATAASVPSAFLSLARVSVATCNHEPAQRLHGGDRLGRRTAGEPHGEGGARHSSVLRTRNFPWLRAWLSVGQPGIHGRLLPKLVPSSPPPRLAECPSVPTTLPAPGAVAPSHAGLLNARLAKAHHVPCGSRYCGFSCAFLPFIYVFHVKGSLRRVFNFHPLSFPPLRSMACAF